MTQELCICYFDCDNLLLIYTIFIKQLAFNFLIVTIVTTVYNNLLTINLLIY